MIWVFGKRLVGKCDNVPGMFHVATQFYHIDYVPLIPLQSWIVISKNGRTFRGVRIPMSGKSVLCAWGRLVSLIIGVVAGGMAGFAIADRPEVVSDWLMPIIIFAVSLGVFCILMWHPICTRAHVQRAMDLARLAGYNDAGFARLQEVYGGSSGHGFDVLPAGSGAVPVMSVESEVG